MGKAILVTGPARSGKSEWAENLAIQSQKAVVYLATGTKNPDDEEWEQRILKHQKRRPDSWTTLEVAAELSANLADAKPDTCFLIDSLGTWVANLLIQDDDTWSNTVTELLETVELVACDIIFVAEEAGWGVVPAYAVGRTFRDRLGNLVRCLGRLCGDVYLVTGGHALNLSILGTVLPASESGGGGEGGVG